MNECLTSKYGFSIALYSSLRSYQFRGHCLASSISSKGIYYFHTTSTNLAYFITTFQLAEAPKSLAQFHNTTLIIFGITD
jgi:hypothetical protein